MGHKLSEAGGGLVEAVQVGAGARPKDGASQKRDTKPQRQRCS